MDRFPVVNFPLKNTLSVYLGYCNLNHSIHLTSLPLLCRVSKARSEAQVPKVILAGRCSKSSAVTGTVVGREIVKADGQVELDYGEQLTSREICG